jgi:hypothetical protein
MAKKNPIGCATTYHAKKAIINPNQAKLKTLPYLLKGLRTGTDRAFPLTGLISGAFQREVTLNPIVDIA